MVINLNDLSELSKIKIELETTKCDLEIAEYEASALRDILGEIQETCLELEKQLDGNKYTKEIVTDYLRTIYILSLEG